MRLLKNIYLVSGSMYGSHQNVYAVRCDDSIVLIDCGMGQKDYDIIQKNLAYWDLDTLPISRILLTHAHCEHSGNAYRYRKLGARIAIHHSEAQAVETGNDGTASYAFFHFEKYHTCSVDDRLTENDYIKQGEFCFQVIHTPGHSRGCVVYELKTENRIVLFTGDTLLADRLCLRSALGWTGAADYDQESYVNSLLLLSRKKADLVLPGHGEICMKEGERLLAGGHLRARLQLLTQPSQKIETRNFFRERG